MQGLFDWLVGLPPAALYGALALAAAIENFFPPLPADTVVALGAFVAARGQGTAAGAFLSTWVGNISGAMIIYALGRRFGAERLERRLIGKESAAAQRRLETLYGRYGMGALFLSRFLPMVRAIVPPFAGALRIPPVRAVLVMGGASALWYGLLTYASFTVGADWHRLLPLIKRYGTVAALVAAVLAAAGIALWWIRRGRRARRPDPDA